LTWLAPGTLMLCRFSIFALHDQVWPEIGDRQGVAGYDRSAQTQTYDSHYRHGRFLSRPSTTLPRIAAPVADAWMPGPSPIKSGHDEFGWHHASSE
jgi:hypothetical protein